MFRDFFKMYIIIIKGNYCLFVDNFWCSVFYKSKDGISSFLGVVLVVFFVFEVVKCFVDL